MLSPRYPSSSSTCDSVEDNRFSTSAFCHEPFHPITLRPYDVGLDLQQWNANRCDLLTVNTTTGADGQLDRSLSFMLYIHAVMEPV